MTTSPSVTLGRGSVHSRSLDFLKTVSKFAGDVNSSQWATSRVLKYFPLLILRVGALSPSPASPTSVCFEASCVSEDPDCCSLGSSDF